MEASDLRALSLRCFDKCQPTKDYGLPMLHADYHGAVSKLLSILPSSAFEQLTQCIWILRKIVQKGNLISKRMLVCCKLLKFKKRK